MKKPIKEVLPFTPREILMNHKRILGRNDFNKYFTKTNLHQAEIIELMLNN